MSVQSQQWPASRHLTSDGAGVIPLVLHFRVFRFQYDLGGFSTIPRFFQYDFPGFSVSVRFYGFVFDFRVFSTISGFLVFSTTFEVFLFQYDFRVFRLISGFSGFSTISVFSAISGFTV